MKILIIEDEIPALNRIKKLVLEVESNIEILGTADSIESSVELIKLHPNADLALMDIELADGQSFEIFNRVQLKCPVVFTTAYDEFALKAFKVNSLDYLLKPIDKVELKKAFEKFRSFRPEQNDLEMNIKNLLANIQIPQVESFKDRFLVKSGQKLLSVSENEIAYFLSQDKLTYLLTQSGNKYVVDYTLDDLDALLNPRTFFRLNRQVFASLQSINSVHTYFNGKLKIDVAPKYADELVVSRERASDFKTWLGA